jgi:hypothetical protein
VMPTQMNWKKYRKRWTERKQESQRRRQSAERKLQKDRAKNWIVKITESQDFIR